VARYWLATEVRQRRSQSRRMAAGATRPQRGWPPWPTGSPPTGAPCGGSRGPWHGRGRGWSGLLAPYHVSAMATGRLPTLIAGPALPVTMEIGVTVPALGLAT